MSDGGDVQVGVERKKEFPEGGGWPGAGLTSVGFEWRTRIRRKLLLPRWSFDDGLADGRGYQSEAVTRAREHRHIDRR